MNKKNFTENEYLQRGACVKCNATTGIGKKHYRHFSCFMAICLLLIGSVLSFPLCAAEPDAQKAAISAGVAAGTDISVIMQNAVAAGMTPEKAVEAIVMAGADPGRVVYEAITAKYSDEVVVKGAAAAVLQLYGDDSAQVSAIVSAAIQAGASASQVNSSLASAGVPPTVIATANTQSAQSPAPAEGYSAPVAAAPLTAAVGGGGGPISGGGGAPIGGSGVGAPQTKQASPYKP